MTPDNDYLERLLAEHAAAKESGLLADGPTATERNRLAVELERGVRPRAKRSRWAWLGGAAAVVLLAVGLWVLLGGGGQPASPPPEEPRAEFLNGRGRLIPVREDTRYTLADAAGGRVRLDHGELFVEVPVGQDLQADIETPAGTARALETSFYAHYGDRADGARGPFLTVAVLGGFVEVRNAHGRVLAGAGDVVLAEGGSTPRRYAGSSVVEAGAPPGRGRWRYASVLGMLRRPEVQAELNLTEEQKARLQSPDGNDRREIGMFFRDLYSVPPEQRARKAAEFRAAQEKKIAAVLDADQQRRLGQVLLQQQGYAALADPEVAHLLQLSEEQCRQVEAVTRELSQARRAAFSRGGGAGEDFGKRVNEFRQQETERLAALLTEAQRDRWRALTGEPFEVHRRAGDWRDWWDTGNWGWWDNGKWVDGREYWSNPENWRGRRVSGNWRERRDVPAEPGPQR